MSQVKPTYEELQRRLTEAERILDALRTGKVDALVGESSPVLLRTLELQRALEESEERFRLISALITDYAYSFLVNPDGSLKGEWVSDSFVKVFGFKIEEIDARGGWPSMVYPEDLPTMFEHAQRVVGGKGDTVEARFVTRTGEIRWIRDYAVPIWDEDKKRVVRVYGSAKDITDQRPAQEALEERDLQIADFMARTEDMICTHDLDGNILSMNQATSRNLGIPTDELLSMKIQHVLDPSVRDQFSQYLARLLQDGQANGLILVITRGGEKRLWEYKNYLRFAKDGTAVAGGMARDVTDTWEAKKALQQAKETLEAIIETAGALIVMVDQDGKIAHFNRACEELTGYRREEVLGKPLLDLLVPEGWREIVQARYANPHDPSLREPHANPWRTRSGEERMIEWRCTPLAGGLLGGVSMVGVGVDVTERVKLEQELTDTSHLLQHVLSTSPIVMYTLRSYDGARRTTWVTSNVEEITGYTVDEALRPGWWEEHLHPEDREEALHTVSGLWSRRTLTYSYRFRRKDGTYMWVRDDIRVLRDETGRAVEAIGAWVDVTEQRMAEEERKLLETLLNQAQEMEAIGRLAGGVAHDFNNMLTVISGYGEIALQELSSLDPVYENIKEMLSAAEKSSELTRQLLAFSRK
ncbi:MAG: PAS domain S-box protein [Thermodesulfobacteriota bacterium]